MVITTIRSNGTLAREIRQMLCERYDVVVKMRHTPDGSDLLVELEPHPKGSLLVEKPAKRNRI